MARGFGSTLGVAAGDKITGGAWTTPTIITLAGWYLRNGLGGLATGRLLDKTGLTTGEITWRTSNTGAAMRFVRVFSGIDGIWEINDAEAVAAGKWVHYVICYDGSSTSNDPAIYINGRLASGSFSSKTAPTGTVDSGSGVFCIGDLSTGGRDWDGAAGRTTVWSGISLTAAEARALYHGTDPKAIRPLYIVEDLVLGDGLPYSTVRSTQPLVSGTKIRPDRLVIVPNPGDPFTQALSSGITGTASITESGDTASSTSTLAIAGALAATGAGDTVSAVATVALAASAGITESNDTVASASTLALAATSAITEAGDTSSATGTLAIVANASITEAGDTLSATGVGVVTSTGTAAITEADDTAASVATLKIVGVSAITEASDTAAATATLPVKATLAANDNNDTLSATATSGAVVATSRATGLRPADGGSTLRLNLSGGPRPGAL